MNSFITIVDEDRNGLYINAWRNCSGYDGTIEYGATVTDWDTLEEIEEIICKNETDAITAWARLVNKYT